MEGVGDNLRKTLAVTHQHIILGLIGFNQKDIEKTSQKNPNDTLLIDILNRPKKSFAFEQFSPKVMDEHLYMLCPKVYDMSKNTMLEGKNALIIRLEDILFVLDPDVKKDIGGDKYERYLHEQKRGNIPHDIVELNYDEDISITGHTWEFDTKYLQRDVLLNRFITLHDISKVNLFNDKSDDMIKSYLENNDFFNKRNIGAANLRALGPHNYKRVAQTQYF